MRLNGSGLRLLAVHAHPDDESSKGAATVARYRAEGVAVLVATCTGGERGSVLNPAMERPEVVADLPAYRRREMAAAREILDVEHVWLGFEDSGWPDAPAGQEPPPLPEGCFALQPVEVAAQPLVEAVRAFRPHVVVTYDERGGYPHPDHVMTHTISMHAWRAAGDPTRYPDAGPAWTPLKLYYLQTFSRGRLQALHDALVARGLDSPYAQWLAEWDDGRPDNSARVTTRVPCGDYFDVRDRALLAHATQIDPASMWFAVPRDVERAVWPTEDYELADSRVFAPPPEDDLFAGVRQLVAEEVSR